MSYFALFLSNLPGALFSSAPVRADQRGTETPSSQGRMGVCTTLGDNHYVVLTILSGMGVDSTSPTVDTNALQAQ